MKKSSKNSTRPWAQTLWKTTLAENTNPGAVRFYSREGYARQEINLYCKYLKE